MNKRQNLAAIDIGTNSFHLIIASVKENGEFSIIDREKEVIRLGKSAGSDIKVITENDAARAAKTISRFKAMADAREASLRAVATSAVRESSNGHEFIELVRKQTGVGIEVIDGLEEARLIYLGILKAVPVYDKKTLCIDIGGGSTEFICGLQGKPHYMASLKLGAVRLSQKFFPGFIVDKNKAEECREWIKGEIFRVVHEVNKKPVEKCVGSSGTIIAAAEQIELRKNGVIPSNMNNYCFSLKDLKELKNEILSSKTPEERKSIKGLDEKRAEIFPAGLIILSTIMEETGQEELIVSDYALREGVILDSMGKQSPGYDIKGIHDIRKKSVEKLALSSNYPKLHCRHVAKLALEIFDNLKEAHKLGQVHREYLEAAALLHDIGYHISHSQHHKHSAYIILNGELLGFTEKEKAIIGNIARYHRKSLPKKSHSEYQNLDEKSRNIVKKLSAILRVADALDRSHTSNISRISASIINGTVELCLRTDGSDPDIELWNLERRKDLFEEVYDKELRVKIDL